MKTVIVKVKKYLVFLAVMMFLAGVCFTVDSTLLKSVYAQDSDSVQIEENSEPAEEAYQPESGEEEAYPTEQYDETQAE